MRLFARPIFTLARRMLVSSALAEDVLQETFVEVLCNIGRFRGEAEIGTWIKRIAINKCLMHVRSSWVSRRAPACEEPVGEERGALDDQMALERALDRVPDMARAVVWLHDVEGYTHAEIGEIDGSHHELLEVAARASARAPARAARRSAHRERDESVYSRTEDLLKLRELPELSPPPGVWERVLETERARSAARRFRRRGAAVAAVIIAAAGLLAYVAMHDASMPPTLSLVALQPTRAPGEGTSYAPLVAESARLDRLLAELPAPRPLMVGSTAGTIVGLEDRIEFIDAQLSYAAARGLAPPYREALWGERVELMNALVYVRFGQTQGF